MLKNIEKHIWVQPYTHERVEYLIELAKVAAGGVDALKAKAHLTVGGSAGYVLPGGGITFMVDVERVKEGSFYWTPTPATICPLEYTMELKDYEKMGGHVAAMKPFRAEKPDSE